MMTEVSIYLDTLIQRDKDRISAEITDEKISTTISDALKFHLVKSANFHNYYFQTLANTHYFLSKDGFFREFKKQYSLQGIDNGFLDWLDRREQKEKIVKLIENGQFTELYFNYFEKAPIQYNDKIILKNLGSFFAKFVHTFKPDDFCALDNPIKDYFGLGKESFFIAFFLVSRSYKEWAMENKVLIEQIRQMLKKLENNESLPNDRVTDLKLLDLIFWYKANRNAPTS
jgi:hypothetical protein